MTLLLLFLTDTAVVSETHAEFHVRQIWTTARFYAFHLWAHVSSPILPLHRFGPTRRAVREMLQRRPGGSAFSPRKQLPNLQPQHQRLHRRVHHELGAFLRVVGGPGTRCTTTPTESFSCTDSPNPTCNWARISAISSTNSTLGPKNYGYTCNDGKVACKDRGLSLNAEGAISQGTLQNACPPRAGKSSGILSSLPSTRAPHTRITSLRLTNA